MQLNRVMTAAALAAGGFLLSQQLKKKRGMDDTTNCVEESIEVQVPVRTAYNQWTQFEDFPQFMKSVHEIRQLDDKHLHWKANVFGEEKEWDSEIVEQIPDRRIAWRSISGPRNNGMVEFQKIGDDATRIVLRMEYEPENAVEKLVDLIGAVRMEARANLKNFKEMLEQRGRETGAWRGTVTQH